MFSLAFLSVVLSLGGCASAPTFNTTTYTVSTPMESVYVYSFLDVREHELGTSYMSEIEKQLDAALTQRGVRSKQLWFNRAPIRDEIALNAQAQRNWRSIDSSVHIPVQAVMDFNASDERAFAPTHVLVVFPTETTGTGVGFAYTVTWRLMDMKTRRLAWAATSRTDNVNWMKKDELPVERAGALVGGLMKELDRNFLLPPPGPATTARSLR
jgi:hypothetical protein